MTFTHALIIAALAGSIMAWQGAINSLLSRSITLAGTTLVVHLVGAVLSGAVVLAGLTADMLNIRWTDLAEAPWYTYLGGALGVAIVWSVAASIGIAGAAPATTAIIAGQVLTAALLDHFGLLHLRQVPFSPARGLGIVLLAAGAWLMLRRP
ncbi:MAG: DMT family transporter [Bacillota bacterium]